MVDRKKKGKGWYLSCQYCFHEWFHQAPNGFSWYEGAPPPTSYGKTVSKSYPQFSNKTNLSHLKSSFSETDHHHYFHKKMRQSYSPFFDQWGYKEELIDTVQEKVKSSIFYKTILILLILLLSVMLIYIFFPSTNNTLTSFVKSDLGYHIPEHQKYFLQMQIQNVTHSITEKDNKKYITVCGTILNPLAHDEILPPLKILAYTACHPDSIAHNISQKEPYCLLAQWEHALDDPSIPAGQEKSFSAEYELPESNSPIIKIEARFS